MTKDWFEITLKDIYFIYSTLKENHPAPVEKICSYPVFKKWFNRGFKIAKKEAERVRSKKDYQRVLKNYVSGFKDRHLRLELKSTKIDKNLSERDIAYIEELSGDIGWIRLKSFYPRSRKQLEQLRKVVNEVRRLREKEIIIFDLRGIEGGYSKWGVEMINNLFSKEYINSLKYYPYRKISVSCRVSKGNLRDFKKESNSFVEPITREYYKKLGDEIERAWKKGNSLVKVSFVYPYKKTKNVKNPVIGRIYVITDESAISATLLFLDRLFSLKGVVQVGRPTGGDTIYGEIREIDLPSKNFRFIFPTTVKHYVIRRNNEKYIPDYFYKGNMKDTHNLKRWILDLNRKFNTA